MHTFLNRANAVFAYAFSCVATVTLCCYLSTAYVTPNPQIQLALNHISVKSERADPQYRGQERRGRKHDFGDVTFDLTADLRPLWNWNVKELFLYITAEYATPQNDFNQVILWDQIIVRGEGGDNIDGLTSIKPEYKFLDDGQGLKGNKNVSLASDTCVLHAPVSNHALHWNIIPNAGALPRRVQDLSGHQTFSFPDRYN